MRLAIDEATQDLKLPLDFKVEYKPYQLDQKLPKEGIDKWEWYLKKNNGDEAAMNGMVKHMTKLCKEVGINLSYVCSTCLGIWHTDGEAGDCGQYTRCPPADQVDTDK